MNNIFLKSFSSEKLADQIAIFDFAAERLLAGVQAPPQAKVSFISGRHQKVYKPLEHEGLTVLGLCRREVKRNANADIADVPSLIGKLSPYGCDGGELLARLFAARFCKPLGPYADILLDELRETDQELVFQINQLSDEIYVSRTADASPLRFADLDSYLNSTKELGCKLLRGQKFGL
ncbi:hypothetical protein [Microvirga massiliensis]|uniref:hypothetical protein n=1 Tax=Microvirga massiliensis TaxID=1033741 RepID=UPI000AF6170E|nr:hypothetical protein [Microvirga massiliensis]